jgi:hypothetical protein
MATAMKPSSAAVDAAGMHAAATEASAVKAGPTAAETASTATPGKGVVRNQACTYDD